jgi:HAE1 family hydrophobic/amphiphilic exporter-1
MKAITVTGYSTDEDTSAIRSRIVSQLEAGSISPAVEWEIAGTTSLMTNSMSKLMLVLVISIFLVYTVMVIQFERFIQPLIIMSSIPFCVIGVILGLLLFGSDISLIAFLGIIALGGIVVNNAIVLIDRMNSGKEEDLKTRIIEASASRLRPVLMTTLTTFFGVLPMALTTGGGSEVYAPLGQAIAGGLVSSTLITLVIIPVLYYLSARHIERKE